MNFQQICGRHNEDDLCFQTRLDFNVSKGGVDTADEMLHACFTWAASRRWPLAVLFNQLDIVALDTYTICKYLQVTTKKGFYCQTGRKAVLSGEKL